MACYIGAAYWFTASTSFANPAAVLGRMLSDSFAGISPASAAAFVLAQCLGAWLGWPMILPIILGSSVIGALVGIGMKVSGQLREGVYVPFGPFLAGAGLVVTLAGSPTVLGWLGWA